MKEIGIAGLITILVAWAVSLRGAPPPRRLCLLYAVGSLLLTIYSVIVNDYIFIVLNSAATALAVANFIRSKKW